MYIVRHFILLGPILLTLVLIETDGILSTLCHSCRFDYQLRVQKRFLSLAMSAPRMGQSDYDIYCLLVNLYWLFFHEHSRFAGQHKKREGIFLTSHYNFHPFHRHLDISRAITVESLPLHTQLAAGPGILYNIYFPILIYVYIALYIYIYIYIYKRKNIFLKYFGYCLLLLILFLNNTLTFTNFYNTEFFLK